VELAQALDLGLDLAFAWRQNQRGKIMTPKGQDIFNKAIGESICGTRVYQTGYTLMDSLGGSLADKITRVKLYAENA
jgi:hypothetical protein